MKYFFNCLFAMILLVLFLPISAFAYHGQEISITLDSAEFISLGEEGNRVNMDTNYTVNDPSLINPGQEINSVMKVYLTNGTLIKTSTSAEGFIANQTGAQHHATIIANNTVENVISVVQYTDSEKTLPLSNPLQIDLNLTQVPVGSEPEHEIAALQPE